MTTFGKCTNCSGTGRVNHFAHIDNGICYACDGTGKAKASAASASDDMSAAHHLLTILHDCGHLTRAQFEANWDWCLAKRKGGMDTAEILAAVQGSAKKRRGW
jgi:hypothetical protein